MTVEVNLLEISNGAVTAPAGCGKTHLIAKAIASNISKKPILVLTHTNAGVVSLRAKLDKQGVSPAKYKLLTIDAWAIRLVSMFPIRSGIDELALDLSNPKQDYPAIREAAYSLLKFGHINDILTASYHHLIVDEYQDCSIRQNAIIRRASKSINTCILGDPLQAIFTFSREDRIANWETEVCNHFPVKAELSTPWRWHNAGTNLLGEWLLEIRDNLLNGRPIDLNSSPEEVEWVQLDGGAEDFTKRLDASKVMPISENGVVLLIGEGFPSGHRDIAKGVHGAVTIEAVDLRDLTAFAESFDLSSSEALTILINFAQTLMTNVGASGLISRIDSIKSGRARKVADKVELAALDFESSPSYSKAADFLVEINKQSGVRVYRPEVLRACIKAMNQCHNLGDHAFLDATIAIREQNRLIGRPLPRRAVGSTLLLKGLESDVAVVLNADSLNKNNLYVAMTRGCKKLVICSKSHILKPSQL